MTNSPLSRPTRARPSRCSVSWTSRWPSTRPLLQVDLELGLYHLSVDLSEMADVLAELNSLARSDRCVGLELEVAERIGGTWLFQARFDQFVQLAETGRWTEAETVWQELEQMGLDSSPEVSACRCCQRRRTREPASGKGA